MPGKEPKKFLLRIDPAVFAAVQKWADDDLRSVNGQIEYLLRQAVLRRGIKLPEKADRKPAEQDEVADG